MKNVIVPNEVMNADVIFASHSGGKDSQAMLAVLKRLGLLHKVVIVHSDLGEMEWETMHPWIESISFGLPCHVVSAGESFFDMVKRTKRMPSSGMQFCTDVLKTQPIKEFIHNYMYQHGFKTAINCTGMRAEESKRRAGKCQFTLSKGDHTSGMHMVKKYPEHTVFDWLVIQDFLENEVFEEIKAAGQVPHEIYSMGFSRLSCVFCVNGRISEHQEAAKMRPELAKKMAELEREVGKTLRMKQVKGAKMPKFLDEYLDALINEEKQPKLEIDSNGQITLIA